MRDLGLLGELTFASWCAQEGLIANGSKIDKTGWDFYIEFPISKDISPHTLHKSAINCKVQVKATDKQDRKLPITLSNLRQMATSQMPCFYVFLEFDGKNEVQRAFILHLDNDVIYSILKRVHEIEQSEQANNLNKRTMTLHYDENNELEKLNGEDLKNNLLASIGNDFSKYLNDKSEFLKKCGFEDGYGTIQFSLNNEESIKKIINVSLGLEEEIDIENLVSIEQRFGIPSEKTKLVIPKAKLKIGISPPKKGKIRFREDKISSGLTFEIDFYNSSFSFSEFRQYAKFRIINDFFDMSFEPYEGKCDFSFNLGDSKRVEIKKLKDVISLITLMSGNEHSAIIDIELEDNGPLSFNFRSKFVERNLEIFDELLNKIIQICQYLKIYDEIFMSLKELYYYKNEIEKFHTIITKSNECDCGVEFVVDLDNNLIEKQVAHISVIACHLGTHTIGVILTLLGKVELISENKFRIKSSEFNIEKAFVVTQKDKLINKNIKEFIDILISKYERNYNVIYAWE